MQSSNDPDWMTAKNDDEYYRIAKRLIDEHFSGTNLKMNLKEASTPNKIDNKQIEPHDYFRELLIYISQNHEEIKLNRAKNIDWMEIQD
jgi:hypothetical protein